MNKKKTVEILLFLLFDIFSIFITFELAVLIREHLPTFFKSLPIYTPNDYKFLLFIIVGYILFFVYEGLYTKSLSFWDEIRILWKGNIIITILILSFVSIFKIHDKTSRLVIFTTGFIGLLTLPIFRLFVRILIKKSLNLKRNVLIIGVTENTPLIIKNLRSDLLYSYNIIGIIDDNNKGRYIEGFKVHGSINNIHRYIKYLKVTDIFIDLPEDYFIQSQDLVNSLQRSVDRIFLVPNIYGIPVMGLEMHYFLNQQFFILEIKNNLNNFVNKAVKNILDVLLSIVLIVIFFIPMIIISILIKLDSEGPIFFTQMRVGKDGKLFKIYKFRTMYINADKILEDHIKKNPNLLEELNKYWKIKDDPRVTRVGKFLRKTSLDELPQLFNVLKGDMSLIGPRPYLPEEIEKVGNLKNLILEVKPGITGLWQVSGRNEVDYKYRSNIDAWYVRNWELWLDIIILIKTIIIVIKREGAY